MGLVITKIIKGGQADRAGLCLHDVIDSYGDTTAISNDALSGAMSKAVGATKLVYRRNGTTSEVMVEAGPLGITTELDIGFTAPKTAPSWTPPSTQLPLIGKIFLGLGVAFAAWGMFMSASASAPSYGSYAADVSRIANLHAMNIKTGLVIIGAALFVSGSTLLGFGHVIEALNKKRP